MTRESTNNRTKRARQAMELAWTRDDGRWLGFLLTYHHHQSHIPRRQQISRWKGTERMFRPSEGPNLVSALSLMDGPIDSATVCS